MRLNPNDLLLRLSVVVEKFATKLRGVSVTVLFFVSLIVIRCDEILMTYVLRLSAFVERFAFQSSGACTPVLFFVSLVVIRCDEILMTYF